MAAPVCASDRHPALQARSRGVSESPVRLPSGRSPDVRRFAEETGQETYRRTYSATPRPAHPNTSVFPVRLPCRNCSREFWGRSHNSVQTSAEMKRGRGVGTYAAGEAIRLQQLDNTSRKTRASTAAKA